MRHRLLFLARSGLLILGVLFAPISKSSLECDGVWAAGVWDPGVWEEGVWTEDSCGGGSGGRRLGDSSIILGLRLEVGS